MPTSGEALPDPKARTLARGPRRYRRISSQPPRASQLRRAILPMTW